MNIFQRLIPEDLDRAKRNVGEVIQGDDLGAIEYTAWRKDGSTFPVNIYASRIIHNGKITGIRGILLDISERKKAEMLIKRNLVIKETMSSISSLFIAPDDLDISIDISLGMIGQLCSASRAYLFLFREDGILMDNTHEWCMKGVKPRGKKLDAVPINLFSCWIQKLGNDKIIHVTDVSDLPPEASVERQILEMQGIMSVIVLPLYSQGKISGFIGMDNMLNTVKWGQKDISILRMTSNIISMGLERKQAEDALQKSEYKFKSYFNSSNDPIIIYDLEGNILEVNDSACEFSGYNRKELLSMSIMNLEFFEYESKASDNIRQLLENESAIYESMIICKNGSLIPIEINNRLTECDGKLAVMSTARDLTERQKTVEAMLRAKLAAEDASRAKSEFITNMSHELRTPLNAIIGFSDILYHENFGALNEYQKKYTSNILRNGKHLLEIINDILSFSKIETGKMELHINEFFVSDVIDEIEALMIPLALNKDIKLSFDIYIETPVIKADMVKFRQVLYNLVNNAIKFTGQGGVVKIKGKVAEGLVNISVEDTGIGISTENRDELFKPFYQVDSSTTRRFGGNGLGLALAKKYVDMHGGGIWVESEPGKGSTFGFSIPVNPKNAYN